MPQKPSPEPLSLPNVTAGPSLLLLFNRITLFVLVSAFSIQVRVKGVFFLANKICGRCETLTKHLNVPQTGVPGRPEVCRGQHLHCEPATAAGEAGVSPYHLLQVCCDGGRSRLSRSGGDFGAACMDDVGQTRWQQVSR